MNLLTVENLTKSYGERVLFEQVTLSINSGEKIGLIGVNGTGKSTFLRVLTGNEPADSGKITIASGVRIEYLPQSGEGEADADGPEHEPDAGEGEKAGALGKGEVLDCD